MANRFSNAILRAIEREQEARHQNGDAAANGDAANSNGDAGAAPVIETKAARAFTMPSRQLPKIDREADSIEIAVEKSVTPESWQWSQPPQLLIGAETPKVAEEPTALLPSARRAQQTVVETESEALTVTNDRGMTNVTNGNSAIGAASFRGVAARPVFRTATINPERVEPHLVAITDPRSSHCEEFRNLRTRILHASQTQKLQAITIASGSPSEGKSTVALNLAWLLAQTDGINALIVDSDLRLPCLADYLDVNAEQGLSEVFSGDVRLEDAIIRLEPSGLHLLPGGAPRADVAEMLSGNRFRTVLEKARKLFDYIIVDAPSLGIFTDAAVLINQTDAALLVVRAGRTKFGVTNRLLETLPRERMFGVVLNGSDEGLSNDTHYDHYYNVEKKRLSE